jgi:hypothetical protein
MKLDSKCTCRATNSCAKNAQLKMSNGNFPPAVSTGLSSLYGTTDKLYNGNYSGAMLQGMELARNAARMLNTRDQLKKKVDGLLKQHNQPPLRLNQQAANCAGSAFDQAISGGMMPALQRAQELNGGNKLGEGIKDPYMMFTPNAAPETSDSGSKKSEGVDFGFGDFSDNTDRSIAMSEPEEVLVGLEEYDVAVEDIHKKPSVSIFDIISNRYIKSGYEQLLKNKKNSNQK